MGKIAQNNLVYIGVLTVTLVLNIFLIIRSIAVEKHYEKEKERYTKKDSIHKNMLTRDLELLSQEIVINGHQFSDSLRREIFSKLIYTYSGDECNKCVFEDIFLLKEKMSKYKMKDVIVLPVMEDTRNVNIALKTDLAGLRYKRLDKVSIKFPLTRGGSSVRFFAVSDTSGRIVLPFFPEVSSPERTGAYLDFIFAKYFRRDKNSITK